MSRKYVILLVDPKTKEVYSPNTGKLEKMNAEHLTDEQLRAIMNAVEEKRMALFGEGHKIIDNVPDGIGYASGSYSGARRFYPNDVTANMGGGGASSDKKKRKYNSGTTYGNSYTAPGVEMTESELKTVCSDLLTDLSKAKHGSTIGYEHGDHFYIAGVLETPGDYYFSGKIPLEGNQGFINDIRKELNHYVKHKGKTST